MREFRMRCDQSEMMLTWLQLARCEGVGPATFAALLERYGSIAGALAAATRQPSSGGGARRVPSRSTLLAELEALCASAVDW